MLYPLNKHLAVEPIEEAKTSSGVLIPKGAETNKNPYKLVKIIETHNNSELKKNMQIIVPAHMIEEVSFFGKTYYLVLENHVIGLYKDS